MGFQLGVVRGFVRNLVITVALGAALAPGAARAWEYPLLPHVNGLAFFPETPNTEGRVSALLSAYYPNECWRLVDTLRVDSTEVRVTIRRATDCENDSLSYWMHSFDLGYFTAGMHNLTVHCTVLEDGQAPVEEEITVPFEVVQGPPPPAGLPLIEQIWAIPTLPNVPVTLTLRGFTPFECTTIHGEQVLDQANVVASFDWAATCSDSTGRWERSFEMGEYPIGDHWVSIRLTVNGPDSSHVEEYPTLIRIRDPNQPPPVDSVSLSIAWVSVEPAEPLTTDSVQVRVRGRLPLPCGAVAMTGQWPELLEVIYKPVSSCEDTSRTFEYVWNLGYLSAGTHPYHLTVVWQSVGAAAYDTRDFAFVVRDPNGPPPPPPPPPVDSLETTLSPNRPNPFQDLTNFGVSLSEDTPAELTVYDVSGRVVAELHRGMLPRGTSQMSWNGRRADGSRAPGGIYFYKLKLPNRVVTRRLVLLGTP